MKPHAFYKLIKASYFNYQKLIIPMMLTLTVSAKAQVDQFQAEDKRIIEEVKAYFDKYWEAYNACEVAKLLELESSELKFFHDKGGIQEGRDESEKVWKRFCASKNRIRAEYVKDPEIYLMKDRGKLYGAIIRGSLKFYRVDRSTGKEEPKDTAKYTNFIKYENNRWLMDVIFSYDHHMIKPSEVK